MLYRQTYDVATGNFKGLYKTVGERIVRGNANQFFLDYGYSKKNSKILYSFQKTTIRNAFSGTLFNNFKIRYESCALLTNRFNVYFVLPSTTDRAEKINRYFNSVKLSVMDVSEESFYIKENGIFFYPSKLDTCCPQKKAITKAIIKK